MNEPAGRGGPPIHASQEGNASRFLTPIRELMKRAGETRPRRTTVGTAMDAMILSQHAERKKPLSFYHHPEQPFAEWKPRALETLRRKLLVPGALGAPSDPVLKSRTDRGGYIEERVEITLTPPFRTEAILTIPKNGKEKHPALVMLHSLGSLTLYGKEKFLQQEGEPSYLTEYRELYESQSLLADYARVGYLCICVDALGFGSRTMAAEKDPVAFDAWRRGLNAEESENESLKLHFEQTDIWSRALGSVGLDLAAITATDDMRTMDYLLTREDVDAKRIGCTGMSFGSFRTNYLTAIDDRVKVGASVCWLSTFDGILDYNIRHSMGFFAIPGDFYADYDMVDIPIAAAPKPFLAISGWDDALMEPCGMALAHLALRKAWAAAGSPDTLGSLTFHAGHVYDRKMQKAALAFFAEHL